MNDWEKRLTGPSKETNQERLGRVLTTLSITVIGLLVVTILVFLASKVPIGHRRRAFTAPCR